MFSMDENQLKEIAQIFDSIIGNPSQAVQDAFKNLVVLATLSRSDADQPGPFESIFSRVQSLEHEMRELRREVQIQNNSSDYKFDENFVVDLNMTMNSADLGVITLSGGTADYVVSDDVIKISDITIK